MAELKHYILLSNPDSSVWLADCDVMPDKKIRIGFGYFALNEEQTEVTNLTDTETYKIHLPTDQGFQFNIYLELVESENIKAL